MLIGKVLGRTEVESGGLRVDLGGPLPRRLVTALLAAEGRAVADDALADTVWDGAPPASFQASLHAYVSRLRRSLGDRREALGRLGDGYRLITEDTDAARFEAGLRRARALLDGGRAAEALRAFDTALACWRGGAYADLTDARATAPQRARLAELHSVAVEERLAALLATGDAPGAVGGLESAVRAEPYRERRWELLIVALYRGGRQADALAAVRRVRTLLADDLGIDPGPALQEVERLVLAQDPALLLPAVAPPRPVSGRANRPLSRFLGRREELALIAGSFAAGRLVTLVGPGGAGKTRLAVEFSAEARPWFVRLADVSDPDLVPAAVAAAAEVRGSTVHALAAALADQPGLLVLDNCEHLVEPVAAVVLTLLAGCPGLRVLATSREALGVDGERLVPVEPLVLADAVDLLTDRVAAVRPGWRPDGAESRQLARIASTLDGIPLALELAAARARVLSLAELADVLGDRFPALGPVPRGALTPHQTLEAAIGWSVDLLSAADRAVLLRLWPFEGGFPLAGAGAHGDLTALSALVARSVVVADTTVTPARYRLLEIVRAYCRDRDPDPAASRAAHAAWVRDLTERWVPELRGERSAHAIRVLKREFANLRSAMTHDLTAAPAAALRTAGLLEWFWVRSGHAAEGLRLVRAALAAAPDAPVTDRARGWVTAALLHFLTGDRDPVADVLRRGVEILGTPPDREGLELRVHTSYYASLMHSAFSEFRSALDRGRDAVAQAREIGDEPLVAVSLMTLGWAQVGLGEVDAGRGTLTEAIRLAGALRQEWTWAMSELLLARALLRGPDEHDPATVTGLLVRARRRFAAEDDVANVLACLHTGAYALARAGRTAEAATLAAAVRRESTRRGLSPDGADPPGDAALLAALAGTDRTAAERAAAGLDEPAMTALLAEAG